MRVLCNQTWRGGYLDYARQADAYRLAVRGWMHLASVEGLYFKPPAQLRLLLSYASQMGWREVLRKVISRWRERARNDKHIAVGLGQVAERPADGRWRRGDWLAFIAACHPRCVERVVIPRALLFACRPPEALQGHPERLLWLPGSPPVGAPDEEWFEALCGWQSVSGSIPPAALLHRAGIWSRKLIERADWYRARRLSLEPEVPRDEAHRSASPAVPVGIVPVGISRRGKPRAVLFGYGQYAKTVCVPNLHRHLDIGRVHEIDPLQIPRRRHRWPWTWSTSPRPDPNETSDVALIAGYHHTHAPLAIDTLRRGADAVVEKPLVVDRQQLQSLLSALAVSTGRFFACFQRRYLPLNALALHDLRRGAGSCARGAEPISYHCVVHTCPLPPRHWYRWPNAHGRIISNGCHWLDHFLFLNDFAPLEFSAATRDGQGTLHCSATLQNGAMFTMVLTDRGSGRTGVSDYVELRGRDVTVRFVDGCRYVSEDRNRVLRRARAHRFAGYRRMYDHIGRRIVRGQAGDSVRSIAATCHLMLALHEQAEATGLTSAQRPAA